MIGFKISKSFLATILKAKKAVIAVKKGKIIETFLVFLRLFIKSIKARKAAARRYKQSKYKKEAVKYFESHSGFTFYCKRETEWQ